MKTLHLINRDTVTACLNHHIFEGEYGAGFRIRTIFGARKR
ncbi:MAG: hypothetical protein ABIP20_00055 [Chthoniobacteraceae bacterium]